MSSVQESGLAEGLALFFCPNKTTQNKPILPRQVRRDASQRAVEIGGNRCKSKKSKMLVLEEDDHAGKPNMGTEFWAEIYTKKSIERAARILDLIDERWPAEEKTRAV